ncbi:MAG: NAD/NADP octopine/nopaline dehydrogenase family protein [Lachnospiraceae bacterium]|nr:NAD/NADP octopine/nopaline dehydrogenase family protein [Lachnospiraceae bacterium]
MRIVVVGGGNIGTQLMVHCAEKGHEVIAYTSTPDLFDRHLSIVNEYGNVIHEGNLLKATNDPQDAFFQADIIIVTIPATVMKENADLIYKYSDPQTMIGVIPGNGGSECAFSKCIERGNVFFAVERVPAIARLVKKGKQVKSTGYREELHVSSLPIARVNECCRLIEDIYDIPCKPIPSFLNLTMTPSNPILHTTRLRTIFSDYKPGKVYENVPLFYEEWDDASSKLLFMCDDEVQKICHALPTFHLEYVKSLKEHYESPTVEAMTKKISGIPAFKGLKTPTIEVKGGFIPDLRSRYFTADFSYGLSIIKQIAEFADIFTPNIDETIAWYESIAIEHRKFCYEDYGIITRKDFEMFYLK